MARISGRNGRLYVGIASAGTAEPITFLNKWSLDFNTDTTDVTSFGDTTKVYVAGLPDCKGTWSGFYDNASAQLYTAATDGVARKFYLYPDNTLATQYWFGNGLFDFKIDGDIGSSVNISGSIAGASAVIKQG